MITKLFSKLPTFVAALALLALPLAVALATPSHVFAADAIQNSLCGGTNLTLNANGSCDDTTTSTDTVNTIITQGVNLFSAIVGIVAVIMIVWGGLRYITSGGDSTKVTNAKNTIVYAIIGLVVVALAQFIVRFVLNKVVNQ